MTTRKAEIAVVIFLATIVAAAALVYAGQRAVDAQFAVAIDDGAPWHQGPILFKAATSILAASVLFGLFYILPLVRHQSREQGKLQSLTGQLSQRSRDLEHAAFTDALTGMNNRRYFDEALLQYLTEFQRIGRPVGLMILDLDCFKAVNDTHGHDVGDEVLKAVARRLLDFARYHDIVARMGGEEFAVVAPNMSAAELKGFAERIREAIGRKVINCGDLRLRITVSVGLAVAEPAEDPCAFYKRADVNLYRAKQLGRNRVCA